MMPGQDRGATATQTPFSRLKDLRKDHGNSYGNGTELRVKPAALASTPILSFNLQQQRPRLRPGSPPRGGPSCLRLGGLRQGRQVSHYLTEGYGYGIRQRPNSHSPTTRQRNLGIYF